MTMTPATHMLLQHQAEVMAGFSADPTWHVQADSCTEDALECQRIAAAAPTPYLAGFWFARSLLRREHQTLAALDVDG